MADTIKGYSINLTDEFPKNSSQNLKKLTPPKKNRPKVNRMQKKVERDPNAPKKPLPAFLLFLNTKRKEMKQNGLGIFLFNNSFTN